MNSNSWAFEQLNQLLSPDNSPTNGPASSSSRTESALSFPISGQALQAQLEAWTNVAFDFDSISPSASGSGSANNSGFENVGQSYGIDNYDPLGLHQHSDASFQSLLGGVRSNEALDPYLPTEFVEVSTPGSTNPSLSLPPYPSFSVSTISPATYSVPAPSPALSTPASISVKPTATTSTTSSSSTTNPKKRRPSTSSPTSAAATPPVGATDEELNSLAVEEDKRRRNTAASARFRIKKKQREQALESTAKELRDKVSSLEREVEALKTENGWLRGLIVGKEESERKLKEEEEARRALEAGELVV